MAGDAAEVGVAAAGAEVQRDPLQILERQILVRKAQQLLREPGLAQPRHGVGSQRLAQLDALHGGAAGRGLRGDGHEHGMVLRL